MWFPSLNPTASVIASNQPSIYGEMTTVRPIWERKKLVKKKG